MKNPRTFRSIHLAAILCLSGIGTAFLVTPLHGQENGMEELTRGPVHEAFAATITYDPEPGMIVSTAPPELIDEIPPEQKPEGENIAWIPGYWGWDDEENDFIWISGVWRNVPPDRQWVPGYWLESDRKWQWISGYWEDGETEETVYVSQPPKTLERGPSSDAPSDNHIWISGNWVHRNDDFAWQPGYWESGRQDWVWVPAHYQWTHRGYAYVNGYWDYEIDRRGVVFAPVRFQREVYTRPDYSYVPSAVISLAVFGDHLFVRPRANHYYFGDYYAPRYRDEGFQTSFGYHSSRYGYDPIYTHNRWVHREERDWDRRQVESFNYFRDHEQARPLRTFAAYQSRPAGVRDGRPGSNDVLAERLDRYAARKPGGRSFQKVSADNRKQIIEQRQAVRNFSQERKKAESAAPRVAGKQAVRQRIQRSPVVGKRDQKAPARPKPNVPAKGKDRNDRPKTAQRGEAGGKPGTSKRDNRGNDRTTPPKKRAKETKPAPRKSDEVPPRKGEPSGKAEKPKQQATEKAEPAKKKPRPEPAGKAVERTAPPRKKDPQRPAAEKQSPKARPNQPANPQRKNPAPAKQPEVKEKTDQDDARKGKP